MCEWNMLTLMVSIGSVWWRCGHLAFCGVKCLRGGCFLFFKWAYKQRHVWSLIGPAYIHMMVLVSQLFPIRKVIWISHDLDICTSYKFPYCQLVCHFWCTESTNSVYSLIIATWLRYTTLVSTLITPASTMYISNSYQQPMGIVFSNLAVVKALW